MNKNINVNQSTPSGPIIVKQQALIFIAFILSGLFFVTFPWSLDLGAPLWAKCVWTSLGVMAFAAGVLGWMLARISLVIDRHGILCRNYSLCRKKRIPWSNVVAAKKIAWEEPDGESEGILLELADDNAYPCSCAHRSWMVKTGRRVGDTEYAHPMLLSHDEWSWNIDEVLRLITMCLEQPDRRNALGEYNGINGLAKSGRNDTTASSRQS